MKKLFAGIVNYIKVTDHLLWGMCLGLSGISILVLISQAYWGFITPRVVLTQVAATGLGICVAILFSHIDYHIGVTMYKYHVIICWFLVALTFFIGIGNAGADDQAWLQLPFGLTLQPAELAKLSFIFTFSMHLSNVQREINTLKNVALRCLHGAIPVVIVHLQGDDGTALAFLFIFMVMIFSAGLDWKYCLGGAVTLIAGLYVVWEYVLTDGKKMRFMVLFDETLDPLGIGYQQIQSKIAIGLGNLFGTGLFGDAKPREVPYMRNDFIFSYICQCLGFVGASLVVILLLLTALKMLFIARMAADKVGSYLCVGVFGILFFQIFENIGMCLGFMPVIGVTLPFLSAGGTSVVLLYASVGVVLSVYMNSKNRMFDLDNPYVTKSRNQ